MYRTFCIKSHVTVVPQLCNSQFTKAKLAAFTRMSSSKKIARTYNIPHPPKDPPDDYQPACVDHNAFEAPDFLPACVYRQFECPDEILGPHAHTNGCYKNPEYFAYHRYSFASLQLATLQIRDKRMNAEGRSCICDSKTEGEKESNTESSTVIGKCKTDK